MKRVVPVAVGLAAGMAVGFFLGVMVTRHGEPAVVIRNATDETLKRVSIKTDFHRTFIRRILENESYFIQELQPHHTATVRMLSHRSTALIVGATTAGGKELSSERVYIASQGVVFALVTSDGIATPQYERRTLSLGFEVKGLTSR